MLGDVSLNWTPRGTGGSSPQAQNRGQLHNTAYLYIYAGNFIED